MQDEGYGEINAFITSLAHILNPEFYIPISDKIGNIVIKKWWEEITEKVNPTYGGNKSRCVGNDSSNLPCLENFLKEINDLRLELNIDSMIEIAFLLNRRKQDEKVCHTNQKTSNPSPPPFNKVLYGPPGTGKTYKAREEAEGISNGKSENVKFVTFHPSFAYENFIEGIWPEVKNSQISYTIRDGILKELSIEAMWDALKKKNKDKTKYEDKKKEVIDALKRMQNGEEKVEALFNFEDAENFVLIIDEINRGNIPSIFGELISLIEENKRLGEKESLITTLPYSREPFAVPKNLYIIGTMNTTDRSVVIMDAALRRRFHFEEIAPNPDLLDGIVINGIDVKKLLQKINEKITEIPYLGRDYQIGHSYFLELRENRSLEKLVEILRKKVLPLLQEYFHGRWQDLSNVLGNNWKKFIDETGRITLEAGNESIAELIKSIYGGNDE